MRSGTEDTVPRANCIWSILLIVYVLRANPPRKRTEGLGCMEGVKARECMPCASARRRSRPVAVIRACSTAKRLLYHPLAADRVASHRSHRIDLTAFRHTCGHGQPLDGEDFQNNTRSLRRPRQPRPRQATRQSELVGAEHKKPKHGPPFHPLHRSTPLRTRDRLSERGRLRV